MIGMTSRTRKLRPANDSVIDAVSQRGKQAALAQSGACSLGTEISDVRSSHTFVCREEACAGASAIVDVRRGGPRAGERTICE